MIADPPAASVDMPAVRWPDTPVSRLEVLALIQTLNADLLSHPSATLTLDRWCADHKLANPATVVAERVQGAGKPIPPGVYEALKVSPGTAVNYRAVRLKCGAHVLSEADNWYVPSRLTADMNHALETSDIAFGRAVQALNYSRHTLAATLLWSPLAPGWEHEGLPKGSGVPLAIPRHVLEHRAVLTTPDGTPFSLVVENYTSDILDFPPPKG
ncbi:hypothetical protein HZF05_04685 [Sphingomonas sp. CGMCC 1.13654]|uniref:Uncharacterized protein n=1 Tax=Sphingomonas chungangi TaxID=2683589 RepID=A0A838L2U3_9SPHN|nr:hypothetical protein [Sphingomonas chungangi]MBA2933387.1 hypothetical protein [Sphingomonas chungangi]MVW54721.1 hypothetical protein [Sphingomonas chungangi]